MGSCIENSELTLVGANNVNNQLIYNGTTGALNTWKITVAIRRADENLSWMIRNKEHMMSVINSYCGLLKHTASFNFRKKQLSRLKDSQWSTVFDFDETNFLKVTIKKRYDISNYYRKIAKKKKKIDV